MTELDLEEQTARIDQLLAARLQLMADRDRSRIETKTEIWKVAFGGMTAGAALFAAGAAFVKVFGA